MDKSFGYMLVKCVLSGITLAFQFIMLVSLEESIVPYLLSTSTILGGYIMDLFQMKYSHSKYIKAIGFSMVYSIIAFIASLSGILINDIFDNSRQLTDCLADITIAAIFIYLIVNIRITKGLNDECE